MDTHTATSDAVAASVSLTEAERFRLLETSEGFEDISVRLQLFAKKLHPAELAHMLMAVLPDVDGRMKAADFEYWGIVGAQIGPDWLEQFKRVSLFMAAADRGRF